MATDNLHPEAFFLRAVFGGRAIVRVSCSIEDRRKIGVGITAAFSYLFDIERDVLTILHGLGDNYCYGLDEAARIFGYHPFHIFLVEKRALDVLRKQPAVSFLQPFIIS